MDLSAGLKTLNIIISHLHFRARSSPRSTFQFPQARKSLRFSPASTSFSSPLTSLPERGIVCSLPNGVGEAVDGTPRNRILQVVLVHPQIPGNTGCIARTCAASAVGLHLVGPLGFQVDDTKLKRAGLDYWPYVVVKVHNSWADFRTYFRQQEGDKRLLAFTKRGTAIHSEFTYRRGDWLVFGSETSGLPAEALLDCKDEEIGGGTVRLPMVDTYVRCLNLSVSVGIGLYEAARQLNYEQLRISAEPSSDDTDSSSSTFIAEDIFA